MLEGQVVQPIVDAIHGQLISLVKEDVPQEIVTAVMRKGHLLVIIDGFSEFDKASREKIEATGPTVPRFSLIVTGRREVQLFGGIAKIEVKPLPVSRTVLAAFLEFLLREAGVHTALTNPEFFDACKNLSKLTGGREISPLLVVLYCSLLAPRKSGAADRTAKVSSVPDIFFEFVNRVNSAAKDESIADVVVHQHLRTIAWSCVSADFRPQPHLRSNLLTSVDESTLRYLEDTLGLIETIKPAQTHVRFLLDPLAEYLAAAFLCGEGAATGELAAFLDYMADRQRYAAACRGLCQAVVDTASAKKEMSALIPEKDKEALAELATWLRQQETEQGSDLA
jgi:hypothetical protein